MNALTHARSVCISINYYAASFSRIAKHATHTPVRAGALSYCSTVRGINFQLRAGACVASFEKLPAWTDFGVFLWQINAAASQSIECILCACLVPF